MTSLLIHAACTVLLFVFLRRRLRPTSACLASVFFACHPTHFMVLYWISAHSDSLALLFALAAILTWESRTRLRILAVPLFALSLLSKESTLLTPLVLAAVRGAGPQESKATWRENLRSILRDPVWWACVGVAIVAALYLFAFWRGLVQPTASSEAPAYGLAFGLPALRNAVTYLGWSLNFLYPTVPGYSDAVDPRYLPWGVAAVAVWGVGLFFFHRLRLHRLRGQWIAAFVVWLSWIAPVLSFRHQIYRYYQYAALVGVAWMAGILFEALGERARNRKKHRPAREPFPWSSVACALACALLIWNGTEIVHHLETAPLGHFNLRAESTVDRALVAERIHDAIRAADLRRGTDLYLWSPGRMVFGVDSLVPETYWEMNAKAATHDGISIRLLFPQVRSVTFLTVPRPIPDSSRYVIYGVDGSSAVATWARVDSANTALTRRMKEGPRTSP